MSQKRLEKNAQAIIRSIKLLISSYNYHISLIIVGQGWQDRLSNMCRLRGVEDNTIFTGHIKNYYHRTTTPNILFFRHYMKYLDYRILRRWPAERLSLQVTSILSPKL